MIKRFFALLLTLCMVIALMPCNVLAADPVVPGVAGTTISGNGTNLRVVSGTTANFTNILYDANGDGNIGNTEYLTIGSNAPTAAGYDLSRYSVLNGINGSSAEVKVEGGYVSDVRAQGNATTLTIDMSGGSVNRLIGVNSGGSGNNAVSIIIRGGTVRGTGSGPHVDLISGVSAANAANNTLTIYGGTINGTVQTYPDVKLKILGGTLTGTVTGAIPTANDGVTPVYKTTVTLKVNGKPTGNAVVTGTSTTASYNYSVKDMKTDADGRLYFYLPEGKAVTAVYTSKSSYYGSVTTTATGTAEGDLTRDHSLWTEGLTVNENARFDGGAGTEVNPYRIAYTSHIAQLALNVNNGITYSGVYFKITSDINLSGKYWVPIGKGEVSKSFQGILDGDNHVIRNMTVDDICFSFDNYARYGFISWMNNATVKNLRLENASVLINSGGETAYDAALLVGLMNNNSTVENCFASGTITASRPLDTIGGLVGQANTGSTVKSCAFSGTINDEAGSDRIGGLVAYLSSGVTPVNCYAAANITSTASTQYPVASAANDCYYLADSETDSIDGTTYKTAEQFANGSVTWLLNGQRSSGTEDEPLIWYQNVDTKTALDATPKLTGAAVYYGYKNCGAVMYSYTNNGPYYTLPEHVFGAWMLNGDETHGRTCTVCGYSYSETHSFNDKGFCNSDGCNVYEPGELNNNGTEENTADDYYEITTAGNLYWFAEQVNKGYVGIKAKLTTDINVNPDFTFDADGGYEYTGIGTPALCVWTPIGYNNRKYEGVFDGNNKTVYGLYYNDESVQHIGLFGYVDEHGEIKNVTVSNSYIRSKGYVGGVCGSITYGSITNCANTGYVSGEDTNAGGVVGYAFKTMITNCFNTGTVRGDYYTGGVCGYASNDCKVEYCYNTGDVTGSRNSTGGMCGGMSNNITIINCYNTGTIRGSEFVGGICSWHNGTVTNCYNTGTVKGSGSSVGAICANNVNNYPINNCYYLIGCAEDGIGRIQNGVGNSNKGETTVDVAESTEGKSSTQFEDGSVAWLLNGKRSAGTTENPLIWYQNINNGETANPAPKFTGGTVYCGYVYCGSTEKSYSNTPLNLSRPPHTCNNWTYSSQSLHSGICEDCGTALTEAHTYDEVTSNSDGTHTFTCTGCGDPVIQEHTYSPWTLGPNGTHIRTCTVCADVISQTHAYDDEGFCTAEGCNVYKPGVLNNNGTQENTADDYYEISVAGQLYWFAEQVNTGNTSVKVKLVTDIDMNPNFTFNADGTQAYSGIGTASPRMWTPAGIEDYEFTGTFDGNGKTVSGLYFVDAAKDNVGLFGNVETNGTIKNVAIENSYLEGNNCVGSICGMLTNGSITNCSNTGTLIGSGIDVGGICGFFIESDITNCFNTGTVRAASYAGGICGSYYSGNLTNCFYLTGCAIDGNGTTQFGVGHITPGVTRPDTAGNTTGKTAADFADGSVTWLLNGQRSVGTEESPLIWYQNIDNGEEADATPKLTGSKVYYINNIYTNLLNCLTGVSEATSIVESGRLVYTDITGANDITNIATPIDGFTVDVTPSREGTDYSYCGTGTKITVSYNGEAVEVYTLIVKGDVTGDSFCDALDCMFAELMLNGHYNPSSSIQRYYDVDMNSEYDIMDFQDIMNYSVRN